MKLTALIAAAGLALGTIGAPALAQTGQMGGGYGQPGMAGQPMGGPGMGEPGMHRAPEMSRGGYAGGMAETRSHGRHLYPRSGRIGRPVYHGHNRGKHWSTYCRHHSRSRRCR